MSAKRIFEVRFCVGKPDGPRAASWGTWANESDGTVYVASRDFGKTQKISLHPPRLPAMPSWKFHSKPGGLSVPLKHIETGQQAIPTIRTTLAVWSGVTLRKDAIKAFSVAVPGDGLRLSNWSGLSSEERDKLSNDVKWFDDLTPDEWIEIVWIVGKELENLSFTPEPKLKATCPIHCGPLLDGWEVLVVALYWKRDVRPDWMDTTIKKVRLDIRQHLRDPSLQLSHESRLAMGQKEDNGGFLILDAPLLA